MVYLLLVLSLLAEVVRHDAIILGTGVAYLRAEHSIGINEVHRIDVYALTTEVTGV